MRNVGSPRAGRVNLIATAALFLFAGCMSQGRDAGRLATEYIRALNSREAQGDLEAFMEKWADNLEHTVALATMRTKDELREFFKEWTDMFTKWKHVEVRRVIQGNVVAWEGVAQGIHRTTGNPLHLPMVMIMEFDQKGKLKMSHVYFDTGVLQQQLVGSP